MEIYLTDEELEKVVIKTVKKTLKKLQGEFSRDNQIRNLKNRNTQLEMNNANLKNEINQLRKKKNKRKPIPANTRHKIFQKYDYRCCECGATKDQTRLTIDHILPVSLGGTNSIDNLQVLCDECNQAKGTASWRGGTGNLLPFKVRLSEFGVREE